MSETEIYYQIRRVKDLSFNVNENLLNLEKQEQTVIDFEHSISFNEELGLINFALITNLRYNDAPPENFLASMAVQNVFEIKNFTALRNDKAGYTIPISLLITIVSISVSHARALFGKNLAGTTFQDILIPIMNPTQMAEHFFKIDPKKQDGKVEFAKEERSS